MRRLGPLEKLSSMRPESKHWVSKIIASSTYSRRNICKTIAIKNQLIFSCRLIQNTARSYFSYECKSKSIVFLGHDIRVHKTVLIRPEESGLSELLLVADFEECMSSAELMVHCKSLNYIYDSHYDAYHILDTKNEIITLNEQDLYECVINYKTVHNELTYVTKNFVWGSSIGI